MAGCRAEPGMLPLDNARASGGSSSHLHLWQAPFRVHAIYPAAKSGDARTASGQFRLHGDPWSPHLGAAGVVAAVAAAKWRYRPVPVAASAADVLVDGAGKAPMCQD